MLFTGLITLCITISHEITGVIVPKSSHKAIPVEDVQWIHDFMSNSQTRFESAIHILRRKHFPFNHDPHPWVAGNA